MKWRSLGKMESSSLNELNMSLRGRGVIGFQCVSQPSPNPLPGTLRPDRLASGEPVLQPSSAAKRVGIDAPWPIDIVARMSQ
jgi:hypothetical protein